MTELEKLEIVLRRTQSRLHSSGAVPLFIEIFLEELNRWNLDERDLREIAERSNQP